MAGRYIPPHMRGSSGSSAEVLSVKAERKPEDGYTLEEISNQYSFRDKKQLGTLNRASTSVGEGEKPTVGFVLVFKDQHPKWPPTIFCKTNLNSLPRSDTLPSGPIPVFIEISRASDHKHHFDKLNGQRFLYAGAHTITRIQYLMPRTPLLIKMLETKFTGQMSERAEEAWNKSLNMRWALVDLKMVDEEEQGSNPMEPLKEMPKKKSVSEMLEEMRLGESGGEKEHADSNGGDTGEEAQDGDHD